MSDTKYRVAVIGCTGRGDYGHGLDVVWRAIPACEIVAVADADPNGLAAAQQRLQLQRGFADYRRMLDEVKPDVVSIAPVGSINIATWCWLPPNVGAHLHEKPMCRSLEEADQMVAACEKYHVKLAIAFQTRYSPKLPCCASCWRPAGSGACWKFAGGARKMHAAGARTCGAGIARDEPDATPGGRAVVVLRQVLQEGAHRPAACPARQ